jgi:hypothetical protein
LDKVSLYLFKSGAAVKGSSVIILISSSPIDDYRKNAVNLILAPYLINVRKVSYDVALNIINSWLGKCGKLRQLDQDFNYMVRYALKTLQIYHGHHSFVMICANSIDNKYLLR